jgi:hypothetical protein
MTLMTHKFPIPTDAEIENLITQVYESMSIPDQSRLSLIESKLLRKARRNKPQNNLNKIPWWIVLLLAGGFASATWWAGELLNSRQNTGIKDELPDVSDKMIMNKSIINNSEISAEEDIQNNEVYEGNDSPVIYQRESF